MDKNKVQRMLLEIAHMNLEEFVYFSVMLRAYYPATAEISYEELRETLHYLRLLVNHSNVF